MAKTLMVIAAKGYQDIEYETPKEILEQNGHTVITTSTKTEAKGSLGGSANVDILLKKVDPQNYDAVVFIGGPGSHKLIKNRKTLSLAKKFYEAGKLTAAICAAPAILANAGILKGKTATCHEGQSEILIKKDVNYTGNPVEKEGNIITASGPGAARDFGKKIAKTISESGLK